MEELLQQKNYYCKPNSGLKMNCKLISGLINKNCKLFLGRYTIYLTHLHKFVKQDARHNKAIIFLAIARP